MHSATILPQATYLPPTSTCRFTWTQPANKLGLIRSTSGVLDAVQRNFIYPSAASQDFAFLASGSYVSRTFCVPAVVTFFFESPHCPYMKAQRCRESTDTLQVPITTPRVAQVSELSL